VVGNNYEVQLNMLCELSDATFEAIERRRNGKEPIFYVQMWPTVAGQKGLLPDVRCSAIRITVPRDTWLQIASSIQRHQRLVVEIVLPSNDGGAFRGAYEHLRKADENVIEGKYDLAAMCCRQVIEAIEKVLPKVEKGHEPIRKYIESVLNEYRAEAYGS